MSTDHQYLGHQSHDLLVAGDILAYARQVFHHSIISYWISRNVLEEPLTCIWWILAFTSILSPNSKISIGSFISHEYAYLQNISEEMPLEMR